MKIQIIFSTSVALLQTTPSLSAGIRSGYLAKSFDEFVQRARSNSSKKQCKKNCNRTYNRNSRAYNQCIDDCNYAYEDWNYFPTGGQCKNSCETDSDCQVGGFNPCGSCGQYVGTMMYKKCYAPKQPPNEKKVSSHVDTKGHFLRHANVENTSTAKAMNNFLEHGGVGYTCGMECRSDSDCNQGGFVDCSFCNKVHGTEGFHTCILPPDEEVSSENNESNLENEKFSFLEHGGVGYTCGIECQSDSDCNQGGFVDCSVCNQVHGTEGFHTCILPSNPAPSPSGVGYTCGIHCHTDSDCNQGGFVDCSVCNKVHGTEGFHTCILPSEEDSNVEKNESDELENFLEHHGNGYSCGMDCQTDSDCYQGGFVDCGVCNQVHGTFGYHTCISEEMLSVTKTLESEKI